MAKIKVPSLQHLARLSSPDSARVAKDLISLAKNSPTFSYEPLYKLLRSAVSWKTPWEQVEASVQRSKYSQDVKDRYVAILPLLKSYMELRSFDFMNPVVARQYLVSRELHVPFAPPMICGADGQLVFPWFIFWKKNPLVGEKLALFATLVQELLRQDSDFDDARFEIVDLSFDAQEHCRTLKITQAADIASVSESRKVELLAAFAKGFTVAKAEMEAVRTEDGARVTIDRRQQRLF